MLTLSKLVCRAISDGITSPTKLCTLVFNVMLPVSLTDDAVKTKASTLTKNA